MTNNVNFISQFRTGSDPCTYKESGELQAEIGKLTHPARPDVDWGRVEILSLALFRQNGIELQTLVCYALARTKRQGLTGMAEGLSSLEALISRRWGDFWPVQVHSRVTLLNWIAERMQQALRTLDIQYQDLAQVYRCGQHLTAMEKVLRQCELWHMTKLDVLAGLFRNTALRLERLAPQGAETAVTNSEVHRRKVIASEKTEKNPTQDVRTAPVVQNDEDKNPPAQVAHLPGPGRIWPVFMAGMVTMACLGGGGLWGWSYFNRPDASALRVQASVMPLPEPLETRALVKLGPGEKAILNQDKIIGASRAQLKQLDKLSPHWALELGYSQLRQLNTLWPDNPQVKALDIQWRKQRERNALPSEELKNYMQAQEQLLNLSARLDALDERRGRYLTGSELKTAVFGIRQSLQTPPLEELLRQLDEQKRAGDVSPTLLTQIDTRLNQLQNRYAILLHETEVTGRNTK
ncbi:type VI secretion system protein VasL [Salmonella enterica subsp. enterica]|uniref:VasL domain-containing protein n=1 Tax=Salmonella enterica TaxID=28901 RepID=UPI000D57BDAE|nr:VasL domain-containing protein [Salmonella enterica]EAC2143758.1 type VI secretion system protein VasL [Salmonella enterica subsp. enterica]EDR2627285.1 type VI secretion system protein VasL [Salmonella enterica subsp. enterica serovar Thompson]EAQ6073406.1 type VI secretion system protein VasL [Salmonella enterica]EAW1858155.1 type VI secretion system protein VasL [Salmonella enterica subsp. enterica]EAW1861760.1 type VI secretion system protein VasL [Salmonella enterica subsp. enterica]